MKRRRNEKTIDLLLVVPVAGKARRPVSITDLAAQIKKGAQDWMMTNEAMLLDVVVFCKRPGKQRGLGYPVCFPSLHAVVAQIFKAARGILWRRPIQIVSLSIRKEYLVNITDIPYVQLTIRRCEECGRG